MKSFLFVLLVIYFFTVPALAQKDIQSFLDTAKGFEYNRKYMEAIAEINKAIEIEPNNSSLYIMRAADYVHLRNNRAVLEDVQTAISLKPNDIDLLAEGARQLYLSAQYEESVNIANLLISLGERGYHLGHILRYPNKFKVKDYVTTIEDIIKSRDALSAFEKGIKPNYSGERRMNYSEGLLFITLNNLKDDANIYNYYDELFKYFEEKREGPSTLGSSLMLHSFWLNLYANYTILYEEKRTPAEVTALFNKIEKKIGLENRAEIYKILGRYNLAIKDLSKVLESTKHKPHYLF